MDAYAYSAGCALWTLVWAVLFLALPRHRYAMLWTGMVLMPAGPISEYWSLHDYWHPQFLVAIALGAWRFGLEDVLLTFVLAGTCAGVFEALAARFGFPALPRVTFRAWLRLMGWGSLGLVLMILLISVAGLGSVPAEILAGIVTSLLMLARRPRLLALAAPLAVLAGIIYWLSFPIMAPLFPGSVQRIWKLDLTWGIACAGVPLEEILWGAVTMLYTGPLLRACADLGTGERPAGVNTKTA